MDGAGLRVPASKERGDLRQTEAGGGRCLGTSSVSTVRLLRASSSDSTSSWRKFEPLPFLILLKEMMDCVVDAHLDFVFLKALKSRGAGGWLKSRLPYFFSLSLHTAPFC